MSAAIPIIINVADNASLPYRRFTAGTPARDPSDGAKYLMAPALLSPPRLAQAAWK